MTLPSAEKVNSGAVRRHDVFMFLLFEVTQHSTQTAAGGRELSIPKPLDESVQRRLNHLVRRVIDRARTYDEYELEPEQNIRPLGIYGGEDRIEWNGLHWTIEDFLALLVHTDDYERALSNSAQVQDEATQALLFEVHALDEDAQYPRLMIHAGLDSHCRNELKVFLLWYTAFCDSRVERLFCKANNAIVSELELTYVSPAKVLSLRQVVPSAVESFVRGSITFGEFAHELCEAYMTGRKKRDPRSQRKVSSIFNPEKSIVGDAAQPTLLVISSDVSPTPAS